MERSRCERCRGGGLVFANELDTCLIQSYFIEIIKDMEREHVFMVMVLHFVTRLLNIYYHHSSFRFAVAYKLE